MALKRDATTSALIRRLGKKAAQAKVEAVLAAEQLRQDELIKLRLHNIKLKSRIHQLEARLRDGEELARDPVQVQYERLQAERLQLKKQAEKQNEEALKVERKISGSLEVGRGVKSISQYVVLRSSGGRLEDSQVETVTVTIQKDVRVSVTPSGPVQHQGEAVLEPGGGGRQARAAGGAGGYHGQEEGRPGQDQAGV